MKTSTLTTAILTDTLDNVVRIVQNKAIGQRDLRNGNIVQTESSVARCAMKMYMLVVECVVMLTVAKLILETATAILDSMNEVVCKEKIKRTEDSRFIEREERILEVGHAQRMTSTHQRTTNQNAICRWLYGTLFESFNNCICFHIHTS